jgi:hypothetical protein
MDKEKLKQIIKNLIEVRGEHRLEVSDEILFVQACSYERGSIANERKIEKEYRDNSPTDKQLGFFRKNNIPIRSDLTKQEAFNIISEIKAKQVKYGN